MVSHRHDGVDYCPNPDCGLHDPEAFQRFYKAIEQGRNEGLIKIGLPVDIPNMNLEWVWAKPIEGESNLAVVRNIPFFVSSVSMNDILEYRMESGRFMAVCVRTSITGKILIKYPANSKEEAKENYSKIKKHFEKNMGCYVEGAYLGYLMLAFPVEWILDKVLTDIEQFNEENGDIMNIIKEKEPNSG